MIATPKVVLTIAGFDPSSGAGITADIKTIAAHGLYGMACITALTVQSTLGVRRVQSVDPAVVRETLDWLLEDLRPAALKIGMLGSAHIVVTVASWLREHRLSNVVLDPVLRSSSGAALLEPAGVDVLKSELLTLADVVTPNLDEASVLTGHTVDDIEGMRSACESLRGLGAENIVITGGHLPEPTDLLAEASGNSLRCREFPGERIQTPHTHGTGCAFSTALACNLGLGMTIGDAVLSAKEYVGRILRQPYSVGKGIGAVNHLAGFDSR